ncbi:hypothetical protein AncyloWKF20_01280 [Ancylobacter sp. WKF20]|uniref:hypothetical protein n=1 Tax=Ancylobacter sp. WKF20 TaxID=3039801 RepID=UPI00243443FD|nr:hypothetical protein [Ancylobacter sp. WKF20]WGD30505.1 hypothetical protein AncyloWKF20_01280 [Ancylobacter sp. WKF20]
MSERHRVVPMPATAASAPDDQTQTVLPTKEKRPRPAARIVAEGERVTSRLRLKPVRAPQAERRFPMPDVQGAGLDALLPQRRRAKRSIGLWASFLLMVALPTIAAGVYYGFFVSNQYVSEFRFAVRNQSFSPAGATATSTALGAAAQSGLYTDNFLVVDYITSRQAVEDLMKTVDLQEMYSRQNVDWLSRLTPGVTMEGLVSYWQSMITANFDMATGLALVRVRAFTPDDAYTISSALVKQSERLINDISARSRQDAVRFAEADVARAEERLRGARGQMRQFRDSEQTPDAAKTAGGTLDLAMKLRGELAGLQSQLASLRTYMDPSAPSVRVLESRIAATTKQIAATERELGKGDPNQSATATGTAGTAAAGSASGTSPVISEMLSNYEDVDLSRQFAEKYYETTLSALELARSEAASQHTYVATYVQPGLAQASEYPRRAVTILIVFLAAGALWFISVMVFFSVRDHVA